MWLLCQNSCSQWTPHVGSGDNVKVTTHAGCTCKLCWCPQVPSSATMWSPGSHLPGSNRRPFGYKPNAIPLSQGGSFRCLNFRSDKIRVLELGHMKKSWALSGLGLNPFTVAHHHISSHHVESRQPPAGLEPATFWLQAKCSTTEPSRVLIA